MVLAGREDVEWTVTMAARGAIICQPHAILQYDRPLNTLHLAGPVNYFLCG